MELKIDAKFEGTWAFKNDMKSLANFRLKSEK